ncbi:branched-chain amino acid aminotransferase [Zavarzinia compransoris]|uniref:branched-chain amino acid aminotransferase n=1 Tax=Zavarzinia marina TaxID=2911065 RepID=UPI001F183A33|nr:branched-chain amino acid aminotransferase [Zavarzinia marina]MCF4164843.1 branched-chain amino acid aminotransferase [Zavarzinia marina]
MAGPAFDDRDGFIWYDGVMVPWRDARCHVLTHALHYASCVFEGERVYGGKVFKLTEHSQRLIDSGRILGFDVPMTVEAIDEATRDVVARNGIVDGYVRPLAWRGSEMMGVSAQANTIHVAIACWLWPSYFSPEARLKGLRLTIADWKRPAPDTAPTASKAAGLYMICTLSKHKAEAAGFDDALMFDYRGRVAEATGANIFFVKDGKLHTPTPDCFLDGITRRTVIDLARRKGIEVIERTIMPEEMEGFEQAFLTGTAAEVTPLSEIGPYSFEVGEITKGLMTAYDDLVRGR